VPAWGGNLLDADLAYARRGWSIIPGIRKKAAGLWKLLQARPADEKTLRRLFADSIALLFTDRRAKAVRLSNW
jgi:hypothetical protein